ncbi:exodeoxyribonuclease VII large subunit [Ihubacter sp. mB4P-1]|uniref:exodeoxyribonuclease VII large subunit n=1 Tax=Ihubacter sp. mB4P-1 TaxID=3242370 RepID=UPI00137B4350
MALKPVTVSQLNEYINRIIGTDPLLGAVVVKGEISNLKYHSTGHVYFSIIDDASKLNCFFHREYAAELPWMLEDGMEVILTGSISVFKKNGTYSLYVKEIELSGAGSLAMAFEQMKNKLSKEGIFDPAHKKQIPLYPDKIGVITSRTGAAVRDILKIIQTRNNLVDVIVFPVAVQGEGAGREIASMIDYVNTRYTDIDTLIVGRGGGSADDLWAFNEEIVARSIYASRIPIISAVGHEIDFTIADLAADLRAETPTAAAQLAVPDCRMLSEQLSELAGKLQLHLSNKLMYHRLVIDRQAEVMKQSLADRISDLTEKTKRYKLILEENNPSQILGNGYTVLSDKEGKIIRSSAELECGEVYNLELKDGSAQCIITEIGSDKDA